MKPTSLLIVACSGCSHVEALGTIQLTGLFERALARLLMAAYKRRLRGIVEIAPAWVSEEILSASEHIGDDKAVLWMSDN